MARLRGFHQGLGAKGEKEEVHWTEVQSGRAESGESSLQGLRDPLGGR